MTDTGPVQRFYDRWAGPYDLLASAPPVHEWRRRGIAALDLAAGETVVEMGCGTGVNLPLLRERVGASGQVIGLDLAPGMLDRARDRIERCGWKNVSLVRGDAVESPIDADVDAVFASFVVGMFADPAGVIETWTELLSSDGRIALLDAAPSDRRIARPSNVLFRGFTRWSAPSSRTAAASPAVRLGERVKTAHSRVATLTSENRRETFGLGYLRLVAGTCS
ncbi:class I SAM-dependent methyltransferase [Halorhabdus rudnickae]|uniref:class I SAM-dependent methyltransferase n=1 Tax=Halorhabdus rudnickae TaxID=1775544 RepID=UPI001082B25E|nr:methyltransferase domain-containing protein [Halorhabdus rudnickae]